MAADQKPPLGYEEPGFFDRLADSASKAWGGLSRLFKGLPIGLVFAAATVLALVEAYMISSGWESLQGVWVARFSGGFMVVAFIWLADEMLTSIETKEPAWEIASWSAAVLVVFSVVTLGFFATQVNNATMDYDAAAARRLERSMLSNRISSAELELRVQAIPTWYEGDKAALEATQFAGGRWALNTFEDCANNGAAFTRQAPVDICNRWGELRVRLAEAESILQERARLESVIANSKAELEVKPEITGDAAWEAIAKVSSNDVSTARASTLALLSAFLIWITAYIWHRLLQRQRKKSVGATTQGPNS